MGPSRLKAGGAVNTAKTDACVNPEPSRKEDDDADDLTFPNDTNPLGIRGLTTTVTAASDEALPGAIAEFMSARGLGDSRADLVDTTHVGVISCSPTCALATTPLRSVGTRHSLCSPQPD